MNAGELGEESGDSDDLVRALGKSGLIIFGGTFLELGISLLAKLIVARSLLNFSYGEVAVGLTTLTLLALVSRLGVHTGVARIAPRHEGDERRDIYLSGYAIICLSSLFVAMILYLSASPVAVMLGNTRIGPVLRIIAFSIPAIPIMRLSIGIFRAEGRSGPKVFVQSLSHPLFRIVLISGVALSGATPARIAGAYVLANWGAALISIYFVYRVTDVFRFEWIYSSHVLELLNFSVPLMIASGMTFVVGETDNLLIQYFLDSSSVGNYDIAYTIGQTLTFAMGAFGFLFLPQISALHKSDNWARIDSLYKLVTKWIIFIIFPFYLVLVLFPETTIAWTFGIEYRAGAPVLTIIATTYLIRSAGGPNRELLAASGYTRFIMYANGSMAVLNILLNVVLIQYFSITGAAYASLISFTLLNILYISQLYREHKVFPLSTRAITPVVIFTGVVLIGVLIFDPKPSSFGLPRLSLACSIAAIIYVVTIVFGNGVQSEDIMLINSAEERLGVNLQGIKRIFRKMM